MMSPDTYMSIEVFNLDFLRVWSDFFHTFHKYLAEKRERGYKDRNFLIISTGFFFLDSPYDLKELKKNHNDIIKHSATFNICRKF